jgi:hypothetical protein
MPVSVRLRRLLVQRLIGTGCGAASVRLRPLYLYATYNTVSVGRAFGNLVRPGLRHGIRKSSPFSVANRALATVSNRELPIARIQLTIQ